jgi:hypothetical protein
MSSSASENELNLEEEEENAALAERLKHFPV